MSPLQWGRLAALAATTLLVVALVGVYGRQPSPGNSPAVPPSSQAGVSVTILAINDFHGHLKPPLGGIAIADPTDKTKQIAVSAGGAEHMATLVRDLRAKKKHSVFVAAGDLIGASPLLSAAFHDEPTIEALSAMGLEITAVGNHEFDEGKDELLRMQNGGCHPKAGCKGPRKFAGAKFRYLAASTFDTKTGKTLLPAYEIKEFDGHPRGLHRPHPEGHAQDRVALGRHGPRVPRRGHHHQRAGARAQAAWRGGHRRADPRGRHSGRRLQRMPRTSRAPSSTS